jgi:hypothetical protein
MACRRRAPETVEKVVTGILVVGGPGLAGLTLVVTGREVFPHLLTSAPAAVSRQPDLRQSAS